MPATPTLAQSTRMPRRALPRRSSMAPLVLLLGCAWLVLTFTLLVVLLPVDSLYGVVVRVVLITMPLALLAMGYWAGTGRAWAVTALMMLIVALTDLSVRQRELSDTSLDPQNMVKLSLWGIGLIVALFNAAHLRTALREPAVALFALCASWCVVTGLWSPIPAYSFGAALALLCMVLFGAVARRVVAPTMLVKGMLLALAPLLWLSLLLYVVAPDLALATLEGGTVRRLAAPYGTPNGLGRVAAIVLLLCVLAVLQGLLKPTSPWVWFSVIPSLACLALSQSRTAALALMGTLVVLALFTRPLRFLWGAIAVAALALSIALVNLDIDGILALVSRTGYSKEVSTLTGRTDIWRFYWGQIETAPILGHGYASSKYLMPLLYRTFWGWTTTHAHNMWIQMWFATGIVGVLLLASMLIAQLRYALVAKDLFSLAFLAFVVIYGMTETGFIGSGAPGLTTVLWTIWLTGPRQGTPVPGRPPLQATAGLPNASSRSHPA